MKLVAGCTGTPCRGLQGFNSKRGGYMGASWQGDAPVHLAGGGDTDETRGRCLQEEAQLKLSGACTSRGVHR